MSMIKLYGVPFSQPVRAVMWVMLMKKMPFEMVMTNPGSKGENGTRHPDYLAKNPGGTIPCIEEPESGFTVGEAHAIMTYLARTQGWTDLYPEDEHQRAKIDQYLHYHHRNVRDASPGLIAPKVRKDLNIPESFQQSARATLTSALKTLEASYLDDNDYLMGDSVTLADIAAYVEIGQLKPEFTNVYDFSDSPKIQAWLDRMSKVDGHDDVHVVMAEMGDISEEAPDMERIRGANIKALQVLKECLAALA
jgi:glutathione S-transferase